MKSSFQWLTGAVMKRFIWHITLSQSLLPFKESVKSGFAAAEIPVMCINLVPLPYYRVEVRRSMYNILSPYQLAAQDRPFILHQEQSQVSRTLGSQAALCKPTLLS